MGREVAWVTRVRARACVIAHGIVMFHWPGCAAALTRRRSWTFTFILLTLTLALGITRNVLNLTVFIICVSAFDLWFCDARDGAHAGGRGAVPLALAGVARRPGWPTCQRSKSRAPVVVPGRCVMGREVA